MLHGAEVRFQIVKRVQDARRPDRLQIQLPAALFQRLVRRRPAAERGEQFAAQLPASGRLLLQLDRQGFLAELLAQHPLAPGDVDDGGVKVQPHQLRLDDRLVQHDQRSNGRQNQQVAVGQGADQSIRQRRGVGRHCGRASLRGRIRHERLRKPLKFHEESDASEAASLRKCVS